MKITLAVLGSQRVRVAHGEAGAWAATYLERASRYAKVEMLPLRGEAALFELLSARQGRRTASHLILLESRGKLLSSEEFAAHLRERRDGGVQHVVLAIGPADGWTETSRERADLLFSLGRVTLPHELARVVAAEQIYRALTILAGHPYHVGH